jgi:hypothetical protein
MRPGTQQQAPVCIGCQDKYARKFPEGVIFAGPAVKNARGWTVRDNCTWKQPLAGRQSGEALQLKRFPTSVTATEAYNGEPLSS